MTKSKKATLFEQEVRRYIYTSKTEPASKNVEGSFKIFQSPTGRRILLYYSWSNKLFLLTTLYKDGERWKATRDPVLDLIKALKNNNIDKVKELIDIGVDLNTTGAEEPLHICLEMRNYNLISLLIERGAKINISYIGEEICKEKPKPQDFKIFKLLVDKYPDVNAPVDRYPSFNIPDGKFPSLIYYIFSGAIEDNFGRNLHIKYVKYILSKKPDLEIKDKLGNSALFNTVENQNLELTKLLLDNGVNINALNNEKETPLHWLIKKNSAKGYKVNYKIDINMVKILMEKGADINAKNKNGETPLDIAKRLSEKDKNYQEIYQYLKEIKK